MNCQLCCAGKATVHLTEILWPKVKREVHLCEACAQRRGTTEAEIMDVIRSASGVAERRRVVATTICLFVGILVVVTTALSLLGVDFKSAWGIGAIAAVIATVGFGSR